MTVSTPIGPTPDSFNSVYPSIGYGQTWAYPTSTKTTRTVTTVKEYDEEGRVIKETTTEVTETSKPDYNPYVTWNGDTIKHYNATYTTN